MTDIAQCGGPEQGIGNGVEQYVTIGMSLEALFVRYGNTPHDDL